MPIKTKDINLEIAANREKIKRSVLDNLGRLGLVIKRKYRFNGCTGFGHEPRPEEYTLTRELSLGVIAGVKETGSHGIKINTDGRFLSFNEHVDRWQEIKANMPCIQWEELFDFAKPVYPRDKRGEDEKKSAEKIIESKGECGRKPDLALEVAIGDKEVEKYFRRLQRNGEKDFSIHYIKALELLKLEGIVIPPLDFLQILKTKQDAIILGFLEGPGRGGDKIRSLREAVYINMHRVPWNYIYLKEPGMTITVTSEFIREKCKEFGVKIS